MLGIVRVLALGDELAPAEWPVVGVHAGLAARCIVSVVLVGAHAAWVAGEDGWPEAALVLLAVASLPGCASPLLCLTLVVVAPAAALGVGRAPGYGAHPVSPASGHGRLRGRSLCGLGVVSVRTDAALGVFVVGLAVLMIGVVKEFNVALLVIGGLLMLGSVAATARRRTGPDPEVTLRPGGNDRPWRRP